MTMGARRRLKRAGAVDISDVGESDVDHTDVILTETEMDFEEVGSDASDTSVLAELKVCTASVLSLGRTPEDLL